MLFFPTVSFLTHYTHVILWGTGIFEKTRQAFPKLGRNTMDAKMFHDLEVLQKDNIKRGLKCPNTENPSQPYVPHTVSVSKVLNLDLGAKLSISIHKELLIDWL